MKEEVPFVPMSVEQEPSLPNPEALRVFGEQYQSIIAAMVGTAEKGSLKRDSLPPELKRFSDAVELYKQRQELFMEEHGLDAQALLAQAFPSEAQAALLADTSKYRLEKLSTGVRAVFVDARLGEQLRPGAYAAAYRGKGKAHFLYIQEFSDAEAQKNNLAENVPHEAHHLFWKVGQEQQIFSITETEPHYRAAFKTFQDELIARASSDGRLGGYHHLNHLSSEQRAQLELEAPDQADAIIERVSQLNGFLGELNTLMKRSTVLAKVDLLQPIMHSRSFDELEQNLKRFQSLVEAHPLKPIETDTGGWGAVST